MAADAVIAKPVPKVVIPDPRGVKVFLCGPQGVGKSHALRTLLDDRLNLQVVMIFTEPSALNVLADKLSHPRLHWLYLPPFTTKWSGLIEVARKINTLGNDDLQKMKGIDLKDHVQWITLLQSFNDFTGTDGLRVGDLANLDSRWVVAIDSLTGMNKMGRAIGTGGKPVLSQPDWGVSMFNLQQVVDTLAVGLACHLVITAHVEYALDDVTGTAGMKIMISTLGRKLGPVLGVNFDEILLAKREGDKFRWSSSDSKMDLRSSYQPLQDSLEPSFVPLIQAWTKRHGKT